MTTQMEKAELFLGLHRPGNPLLLPNPWDSGSAKLLASLGFQALATTSSGFAATLGRLDGSVSRDEALAHAAAIVAATELPVSADLENCFADDPDGVARTVTLAARTGLAGCSVEDYTGDATSPIYETEQAAARVAAAAEAAHAGPARLVLTARAENYLHGRPDLADTITRLQAYQAAGADVLYAPGLTSLADIRQMLTAVDRPVNVLAMPGAPPVGELAEAGVSRISVGGAFAFAALSALADAATELRDKGTYGYLVGSAAGRRAVQDAVLNPGHTEIPLAGGNMSSGVVRVGDTVRRPAGPWTPAVHALLTHLHAVGFHGAPRPLGIDERGREILTFIPGTVAWPGHFHLLDGDGQLRRVARLIREFHDATAGFTPPPDARWQALIPADGDEIIAHHDLAPWNLVIGDHQWAFIDWDTAAPGTRLWDLAYALHGFVPLTADPNYQRDDASHRLRLIADTYDLTQRQRLEIIPLLAQRTQAMHTFLAKQAAQGTQPWARLWQEGHGESWRADTAYIAQREHQWHQALLG